MGKQYYRTKIYGICMISFRDRNRCIYTYIYNIFNVPINFSTYIPIFGDHGLRMHLIQANWKNDMIYYVIL